MDLKGLNKTTGYIYGDKVKAYDNSIIMSVLSEVEEFIKVARQTARAFKSKRVMFKGKWVMQQDLLKS
ncbi:hypothetical protein MYP_4628 [Sporocytophaga myxococcoides]|uniref:Uncharacterized protein n=2 Tax=Sporocytophaga myxococcoides TaxID=153721 RepID=A0A098LMQ9_9BACT|nr:hypothetical protein MYP_4628 [Sporocytophaga myxococcoides]